MRKLIFILMCSTSLNSFSQEDTIFANKGFYQNIECGSQTGNGYIDANAILESYDFDSSVNFMGNSWKIIRLNGSWSDTLGYYRIEDGKIWYKGINPFYSGIAGHEWDDTTMQVLYDFNLSVGDTAYVYDHGWTQSYMVVESINFTNILGFPRREYHLEGWGESDVWIEGMGSKYGLFYHKLSHFEIGYSMCFFSGIYEDSVGHEYFGVYDGCWPYLGAEELKNNPLIETRFAFDKLYINSESPEQLYIFTYDGKLITKNKILPGENIIDIDFLERGAYILRIGANYSEKFIKQ